MIVPETNEAPLVERVQSSFKQLSVAALNLNIASDELGKSIAELDASLKKLNVGVSAWVTIQGAEDNDGSYWSREIGYDKVGKQGGITLKTTSGHLSCEEYDSYEKWSFNEAPRWLRIAGVEKIPDLLDKLAKEADSTMTKIKRKTAEAKQFAAAINTAVDLPVKK